ncbi:MAG TPA: cyclopropane-fatty-acyl-phospholipid synthase family protein [Caulobacteraceae bacterium]|nr:cyclopropane-fatty-acyl-phospholipid synthase family protein [Caulobacteraceae bacterium]
MSLESFLQQAVREGSLELALPGRRLTIGDGAPPRLAVAVTSALWAARIAAWPETAVGDAYMAGALVIERGDIYDLLDLAGRNLTHRPDVRRASAFRRWRHDLFATRNARRQARRNAERHYDLSNVFYRRFLDEDMQYSCAYFDRPDLSLEEAQRAKQRHIEAKLLLRPGLSVLDIGCGWGGLALRLAADAGAIVDGVTLSTEQVELARRRAEDARLADRVRYSLTDYRDVAGPYDRIVSVGMFEHVGRPNHLRYFRQVRRLLADDGVALIHSIGRAQGPDVTQPWIAKHIFPGGYIPALSETLAAVEKAGLYVTDVEILRLHYAETLRAWRLRFAAARPTVARIRGERFCRMWEFYLAASEVGFRYAGHMVFQLQLTRRIDTVPITRAYIAQAERRLAEQQQIAA